MANPVLSWINTYAVGAGPATASSWLTFSFCMTQGFEARLPVEFLLTGNMSFSPEISILRSTDNGASWENLANRTLVGVFTNDVTNTSRTIRKVITLETGRYMILVQTGSSALTTYSAYLGTAEIVSAYA